jgi:hypothetical protein
MDHIENLKKSFDVMQMEVAKALSKLPDSVAEKRTDLMKDLALIQKLVKEGDEVGLRNIAQKYADFTTK